MLLNNIFDTVLKDYTTLKQSDKDANEEYIQ